MVPFLCQTFNNFGGSTTKYGGIHCTEKKIVTHQNMCTHLQKRGTTLLHLPT